MQSRIPASAVDGFPAVPALKLPAVPVVAPVPAAPVVGLFGAAALPATPDPVGNPGPFVGGVITGAEGLVPGSGGKGWGPPRQPARETTAVAHTTWKNPAREPICASLCQKSPRNTTNLRLVQRLYQTVPVSDTSGPIC